MLKLLLKWLLSACALLAVAYLYSGVQVSGFGAAMWAALFIGLLNALVRPILFILTLPITILTLGLFFLRSFGAALLGSILYSIAGVIIDSALEGVQFGRRR
ncbi:MAG: hypothetical protein B7X36_13470 [Thiomonas sp. 14-64-326]|nr:MAG: hypothetical protein B7X36_13470 [Thiomonas sp. 14-64-326]